MNIENAFTESKTDWWHFILGFIVSYSSKYLIFVPFAVLIFMIFLCYEIGEKESKSESYFDLLEFILGFCFALLFK